MCSEKKGAVTAHLICAIGFTYADHWFSDIHMVIRS